MPQKSLQVIKESGTKVNGNEKRSEYVADLDLTTKKPTEVQRDLVLVQRSRSPIGKLGKG